MLVATIHLSHPDLTMRHTLESAPSVSVGLEYQTATEEGRVVSYLSVSCDSFDDFETALDEDETVVDWLETGMDGRPVYAVELGTDRLRFSPTVARLGIQMLDLTGTSDGWTLRLRTPDREPLASLRQYCDEEDIAFELRSLTTVGDESGFGLTAGQREALRVAYDAGYFEEPRRVSLADLGDRLGISATAVSRRLRRGTATFVEAAILDNV